MAFKVIVLTDRRLVPLADIPARIAAILAVVPAGTVAIQIREKDLDGGPLLALTRAVLDIARPLDAEVWVNDRVDVAIAAAADGVHLPEHGLSIDATRALVTSVGGPTPRVGCSRHSAAAAALALGADLVQLGPIWSTPDKGTPLGPAALAIRGAMAHASLVAVGGIDTAARAAEASRAGADAVAVLRAAWQSADAPDLIAAMVQSMK